MTTNVTTEYPIISENRLSKTALGSNNTCNTSLMCSDLVQMIYPNEVDHTLE
jgi:hypothetical protein